MSANPEQSTEPIKVLETSLQSRSGPSVMLCNLPFRYTLKMLTTEIKELGFDIPGDIVYIHLPNAANTQMNYGHALIVFTGRVPLNAFYQVFQGRVFNNFKSEPKA